MPHPIRALVLAFADDRSAIALLTSCRSHYAGYHSYPLKSAMPLNVLRSVAQLDEQSYRMVRIRCSVLVIAVLFSTLLYWHVSASADYNVPRWFGVCLGLWCLCEATSPLTERRDCCTPRWWHVCRRPFRNGLPRVTRLAEPLADLRLLPYLQHLTELTTVEKFSSGSVRLPRSLFALDLQRDCPDLLLQPDTLPSRLTSLSLSKLGGLEREAGPLPAGVLPQSLRTLVLHASFDMRRSIRGGVLPDALHRLDLRVWSRPLSNIALPASLVSSSTSPACPTTP